MFLKGFMNSLNFILRNNLHLQVVKHLNVGDKVRLLDMPIYLKEVGHRANKLYKSNIGQVFTIIDIISNDGIATVKKDNGFTSTVFADNLLRVE